MLMVEKRRRSALLGTLSALLTVPGERARRHRWAAIVLARHASARGPAHASAAGAVALEWLAPRLLARTESVRTPARLTNREIRALSRRWRLAFLPRQRGPDKRPVHRTIFFAIVASLRLVQIFAGSRDDFGCLGLRGR
jgi:hypothetical protein